MKTFENIKSDCVHKFLSDYSRGWRPEWFAFVTMEGLKEKLAGTNKSSFKLRQEVEDKCISTIKSTDIRAINGLLTLFPTAFPAYVRNGKYSIEYGDNGYEFHPLAN